MSSNETQPSDPIVDCPYKCAMCGTQRPRQLCSKCMAVRYCNADCQVADWPQHKNCCVDYRTVYNYSPPGVGNRLFDDPYAPSNPFNLSTRPTIGDEEIGQVIERMSRATPTDLSTSRYLLDKSKEELVDLLRDWLYRQLSDYKTIKAVKIRALAEYTMAMREIVNGTVNNRASDFRDSLDSALGDDVSHLLILLMSGDACELTGIQTYQKVYLLMKEAYGKWLLLSLLQTLPPGHDFTRFTNDNNTTRKLEGEIVASLLALKTPGVDVASFRELEDLPDTKKIEKYSEEIFNAWMLLRLRPENRDGT